MFNSRLQQVVVQVALKTGARCIGIDVRPECLVATRRAADAAGVGHLVEAVAMDMMEELATHPLWAACNVVYAYVMPHMNQDHRLQPVLRRAVDDGKRILLYCTSGSRVRRPGAPEAGNRIGDLEPMASTNLGMLRLYCSEEVAASRPELQRNCERSRALKAPPPEGRPAAHRPITLVASPRGAGTYRVSASVSRYCGRYQGALALVE